MAFALSSLSRPARAARPALRARRAPHASRCARAAAAEGSLPEALLFDCDGVLVETERDGHRVSFNAAFKEKGIPHEWGVEQYGELLKIGGGKERMTKFFSQDVPTAEPFASITDEGEQQALVKGLHLLKTQLFLDMVEAGELPLRPGVARLVGEAIAAGVPVAVCSTSNEVAVQGIVTNLLGEDVAKVMPVFAGDVVPKKKPAPDIYLLAAEKLGVDPARCVVVEDSGIGLAAAKGAGMRCIVTESLYTAGEDFAAADKVVDCIGEADDARISLKDITFPGPIFTDVEVSVSA
mmetsp:Transcript_22980/g.78249  ORF Transcript_22980/g.78249 Transcript_22980/m.78249 type:complete len:294 (-) Transcript_22980:91-972(-)